MKPSDLMKRIIFNCNNKDGKGDNIDNLKSKKALFASGNIIKILDLGKA